MPNCINSFIKRAVDILASSILQANVRYTSQSDASTFSGLRAGEHKVRQNQLNMESHV